MKDTSEYTLLEDGTYSVIGFYDDFFWEDYPTEYNGRKVTEVFAVKECLNGEYLLYPMTVREGEVLTFPDTFKGKAITALDASEHELAGECDKVIGIEIPSTIKTLTDSCFSDWSMSVLVIPDTVERIGSCAFYNCTELKDVRLPEQLKIIRDSTFRYCYSLRSIDIPPTVEEIGELAFENCRSLTEITLPPSLIRIGDNVFDETPIESLEIPAKTTEIEPNAFTYSNIKRFSVHPENPVFCVIDGNLCYLDGRVHTLKK